MRPKHAAYRRRPNPVWLIIAFLVLAMVILPLAAVLAVNALTSLTRQINTAAGVQPAGATFVPRVQVIQAGAWQGQARVTILLLGIDQRPGEDAAAACADTVMLLTVDPQASTAGIMGIPRDLYVPFPNGGQDRINAAYAAGGLPYAMQTVEFNFGIPVQHYARINFDALTRLVDLAGGIDVYVEAAIDDPQFPDQRNGYAPFAIGPGWHHLDGATALKYARTRHGSDEFRRMRRQQQVILALRDAAQKPEVAARLIAGAPEVLSAIKDTFQTDLTILEITQLAALAQSIPPDRVSTVMLDETSVQPWTAPQAGSVLVPIRDRIAGLRDRLYNPPATPAADAATPAPETGRVAIQNGTLTEGLASATRAYLEGKGYVVPDIGNAPARASKTVIVDYTGRPQFIAQLAAALGVPASAVTPSPGAAPAAGSPVDALVILGDDYQPAK